MGLRTNIPALPHTYGREGCHKGWHGMRKWWWGDTLMALVELKQCLRCGKTFLGSAKRKFCSKQCRNRFHKRFYIIKRMQRDAEFKQRSLARLYAWKERRKREREAQREGETKQQVVFVDIEWI